MSEQEALIVISRAKIMLEVRGIKQFKRRIREAWSNGDYSSHGLFPLDSGLQRVRNVFGPSWLHGIKPDQLFNKDWIKGYDLNRSASNGELVNP